MLRRTAAYLKQNALAALALFVALGGTSYAISLPAGSVGTQQLRNKSVTSLKLDPKSIAGYIADWAQISAAGRVVASSPRATVVSTDTSRGLIQVYWHRAIPSRCITFAEPVDVAPLTASATAHTFGPVGHGRSMHVLVATFDATGNNVPENVNVVVICP